MNLISCSAEVNDQELSIVMSLELWFLQWPQKLEELLCVSRSEVQAPASVSAWATTCTGDAQPAFSCTED